MRAPPLDDAADRLTAALDHLAHGLELLEIAQQVLVQLEGRGASGGQPGDQMRQALHLAAGGRVDRLLQRVGRHVADDGAHVRLGDLRHAIGVEAELLHLAARRQAIGAEARAQLVAGGTFEGQPRLAQFLVDHLVDRPALVLVARQRDGEFRPLDVGTQRRALLQVAGFQDDDRAVEPGLAQIRDGVGQVLAVTGAAHAHQALAAEHRDGGRLVVKLADILLDLVGGKAGEGEGIAPIDTRMAGDHLRALGDEAGIGTVEQHDREGKVRPRQKGFDLAGLFLCHGPSLRSGASMVGER